MKKQYEDQMPEDYIGEYYRCGYVVEDPVSLPIALMIIVLGLFMIFSLDAVFFAKFLLSLVCFFVGGLFFKASKDFIVSIWENAHLFTDDDNEQDSE